MNSNLELLRQIQEDAVSAGTSVSELLRRCHLLAARVGIPELADWVQHELNGYPTEAELPDYRIMSGIAKGHLFGPFGSGLRNAILPAGNVPEEFRDWATTAHIRQPIAAVEEVARNRDNEELQTAWPGDLVALGNLCAGAAERLALSHGWA